MRTTLLGSGIAVLSLLALAPEAEASHQAGPYAVDIVMNGVAQPVHMSGGQAFVAGAFGSAYQIRVHNRSGRRVEAVVAVDGRDVLTGQPVRPRRHRGHIIQPYGTASIQGFRSTTSSVATFRFSTIPGSYAWRTGTSWGIGTIRVWIFEESAPPPPPVAVVPYGGGYFGDDGRAAPQSAPSARSRAGGAAEAAPSAPRDMGTQYGEQRWDPVRYTSFTRASRRASTILGIRYQSREALISAGIIPTYQPPVLYQPAYCPGCYYPPPTPFAPPPPGYPYY